VTYVIMLQVAGPDVSHSNHARACLIVAALRAQGQLACHLGGQATNYHASGDFSHVRPDSVEVR